MKRLGLTPLARVVASAVVGSDPKLMLTGPMTATVEDNALMLEAIAGPDGLDPRQYSPKVHKYTQALGTGAGCAGRDDSAGDHPTGRVAAVFPQFHLPSDRGAFGSGRNAGGR